MTSKQFNRNEWFYFNRTGHSRIPWGRIYVEANSSIDAKERLDQYLGFNTDGAYTIADQHPDIEDICEAGYRADLNNFVINKSE